MSFPKKSKFGGVPVEDSVPKSQFGGIAVTDDISSEETPIEKKNPVGNELDNGTSTTFQSASGSSVSEPIDFKFPVQAIGTSNLNFPTITTENNAVLSVNPRSIPIKPYRNDAVYLKEVQQRINSKSTTQEDEVFLRNQRKANGNFNAIDETDLAELTKKYSPVQDAVSSVRVPDFIGNFIPEAKGKTFGDIFGSVDGKIATVAYLKQKINEDFAAKQDANRHIVHMDQDADNDMKALTFIQDKLAVEKTKEGVDKIFMDVNVQTDESGNTFKKLASRLALVSPANGGSIAGAVNISTEAEDHLERQPVEFSLGLNVLKYSDPEQYKRVVNMLETKAPLSDSLVANLVSRGADAKELILKDQLIGNVIDAKKYDEETKAIKNVRYDNLVNNKETLRSFLSSGIANMADDIEQKKREGNVNISDKVWGSRWSYTDEEIARYGKAYAQANGIDPNDSRVAEAIKYLQDNEGSMILENSISKTSWTRDLAKGLAQPIRGLSNSVEDILKTPNDVFNEGQSQGNVNVAEERVDRVKVGWQSVVSDVLEGTGQFITQAGMAAIVSPMIGSAGSALLGRAGQVAVAGDIALADMSAVNIIGKTLLQSKEAVSTFITSYGQSYDSNLKQALNYTADNGKAKLTANIMSGLEGATELFLSPLDIAKGITNKLLNKKEIARGLVDVLSDAAIIDKNAAVKTFLKASLRGGLETTKVISAEIGEEWVTQVADYTANAMLNPDSQPFKNRSLAGELATTAYQTGLSMALPALLSGAGSFNANSFSKGSLLISAQNRQRFIDDMKDRVHEGSMSQTEYEEKAQIINTAHVANATIPTRADGSKLNSDEKADYVFSRVTEGILNKKIAESNDEAEKQILAQKVKAQQDLRTGILSGNNSTLNTTRNENTTQNADSQTGQSQAQNAQGQNAQSTQNANGQEGQVLTQNGAAAPAAAPLSDDELLSQVQNNPQTSDIEKKEGLQYFIDKAGEVPAQTESRFGPEVTQQLLAKVPTEKLQANLDFLIEENPDDPNLKILDDEISRRESAQEPVSAVSSDALKDVESTTLALDKVDTEKQIPFSLDYLPTDKRAIAEAYHADKAAGKETELTKSIESLFGATVEAKQPAVTQNKQPEIKRLRDTEIRSAYQNVKPLLVSDAQAIVTPIIDRINNAEYINENELEPARTELYNLLDKIDRAPEQIYSQEEKQSIANLVEPLINKIENYELTTKTESGTTTKKVPVKVARETAKPQPVNKSISQWEGSRATVTDANGKKVEGIVRSMDGRYYLVNGNGDKVAVLGEKAITDRDITLPSSDVMAQPIEFDDNGDVKSVTFQLNKLDKENGGIVPDKLITINFKDKDKALDFAIQLRAEQVGEIPQPEFDLAFKEVEEEYQREVLKYPERNTRRDGVIGIAFAPYREVNVQNMDEDAKIRASWDYKLHMENVKAIAKGLGIKIIDASDTWGGYVDTETGRPVQEVSNLIHVEATPAQAKLMAAVLGKAAPDLQDAVLVGNYSDNGAGVEHTINVGGFEEAQKIIPSIKENGIDYFTVDIATGDIIILDFANENLQNITNFVRKLSENGKTTYEINRIDAEFIGREGYDGILAEESGSQNGNEKGFDIDAFIKEAKSKYAEGRIANRAGNTGYNEGQGNNQSGSGANSTQSNVNESLATQGFFSNTVNGANQPKKSWAPLLPLKGALLKAYTIWKSFRGNFDTHIETSIPAFRDVQIKKINAIASVLPNGGTVIDLGGSEGGFGKTISSLNPKIKTINLDMNADMQKAHEKAPVKGADFVRAAFGEDVTMDDGTVVKRYEPAEKADVVHESMLFQFITPERQGFIDEIADNYIKDDGVLILEEKVIAENFHENEIKKDNDFKSKYWDKEAMKKKGDEVLVGMKKNQTEEPDLLSALSSRFKYVYQYWDAGNFKGYLASNDQKAAAKMLSAIGDTKTNFTSRQNLVSIEDGVSKNMPVDKPETKNKKATPAAAGNTKSQPAPENKPATTYQEKAKAIADKIRSAELPSWLINSDPNIKGMGPSGQALKDALADAVEIVGQLLDKGVELKNAITSGLDSLKAAYAANNIAFDEKAVTKGFTDYVTQQFPAEPTIKEIADLIRKGDLSYNAILQGKSQEYIDNLNKELFGDARFNFDADAFREQVRKQKLLGLTQSEVEQLFNSSKKLTRAQKQLIAETYAADAQTDKIAAELKAAFDQIAQGQKPKSVLERLSVSNVSVLVNAMRNALTYNAVSIKQLEDMADFVVASIDITKSDQYINAMINNQLSDVRQILRAKLIVALQGKGNKALSAQLIQDMADEATMAGRQTKSLQRVYEILGAKGNASTRTEFARRAALAVQEKARNMTKDYADTIAQKEAEISALNAKIHAKVQNSSLINKLKNTIAELCALRNK